MSELDLKKIIANLRTDIILARDCFYPTIVVRLDVVELLIEAAEKSEE